ncbi:MAG TPA: hypothetical protein VF503_05940 [Sphingobium sp.]|uniref:hypothetical protein n=1 Tax=Sphingobium sp. TaxID=1912891 RepID=UPI002ED67D70
MSPTAPTIRDVARCYRLFLGREMENVAVAGQQIAASTGVLDMVERIWASPEAVRLRMGETMAQLPGLHLGEAPDMDAGPEQLKALYDQTLPLWSVRGLGSYYQWLRRHEPRFADRSSKWNVERVLAAGMREAEEVAVLLSRHGHRLTSTDRIAVLGAEAFRLATAWAPSVASYSGIEVSESDLVQAGEC